MTDTPRTAAGRDLLIGWWGQSWAANHHGKALRDAILAIEAEAATLDVERLARAIENQEPHTCSDDFRTCAEAIAAAYASGSEAVETPDRGRSWPDPNDSWERDLLE